MTGLYVPCIDQSVDRGETSRINAALPLRHVSLSRMLDRVFLLASRALYFFSVLDERALLI